MLWMTCCRRSLGQQTRRSSWLADTSGLRRGTRCRSLAPRPACQVSSVRAGLAAPGSLRTAPCLARCEALKLRPSPSGRARHCLRPRPRGAAATTAPHPRPPFPGLGPGPGPSRRMPLPEAPPSPASPSTWHEASPRPTQHSWSASPHHGFDRPTDGVCQPLGSATQPSVPWVATGCYLPEGGTAQQAWPCSTGCLWQGGVAMQPSFPCAATGCYQPSMPCAPTGYPQQLGFVVAPSCSQPSLGSYQQHPILQPVAAQTLPPWSLQSSGSMRPAHPPTASWGPTPGCIQSPAARGESWSL
mmetsp:Transcript_91362/g.293425  ORF Transcript_91362/g.293425 Transcript_91362/m.293425 type:complete len:300 (+) Transcript_91362:708-1607(+)